MWGKLRIETVKAAIDARLSGSAFAALAVLACYSRDARRTRKGNAEAVRSWAAENAPHVDADGLQVVSMSVSQLQAAISPNSRATAQDAIRRLKDAGLLIEVSGGRKGSPALFVVGPLPAREDGSGPCDGDDPRGRTYSEWTF